MIYVGIFIVLVLALLYISTLMFKYKHQAQMEMEKRKRKDRMMRILIDNSPIPTTIKDVNDDNKYIMWNKAAEQLYFVSQNNLIGNKATILQPNIAKAFQDTDLEAIQTGKSSTIQRLILADNKVHILSMHKTLVGYGAEKWLICSALDISELEEKKNQLEELNKRYELLLKTMGLVPWVLDVEKQNILYDRRFEKKNPNVMLPSAESVENFCKRIIPEQRESMSKALKDLTTGEVESLNEEFQIMIGEKPSWIESLAVASTRNRDGKAITLVGANYSIEEKKQQQSLILDREKAEERHRLLSAFLANMSHEIRTPLNAIVGFSNLLAELCNNEEANEYIHIIEVNNELLLQLINDILDLSKIEAGMIELNYSYVDIHKCLHEIITVAQTKVKEKVELSLSLPLDNLTIYSDRNRSMQVINNFVNNAIKYTDAGKIDIGYYIPENNYIRFYVKDTGVGIPSNLKEKVFDRFIKLDRFRQGTGLGLSICKMIAEKMSGRIGVESEEGKGSEFWFEIPVSF